MSQDLLVCVWDVDDVEMTHESRCELSSSSWRSSSANKPIVVDYLFEVFGSVIYEAAVNELPEQLNRWLSSIGLDHGHVDVIDEDQTLLASICSDAFLSSFLLEFRLDHLLEFQGRCLCREVENNWSQIESFLIVLDELLDQD